MYNNLIINSPLEQFETINLIGFNAPIFGYINVSLTNLALYCIIVLILILSLHLYANNNNKLVPSKWSIVLESSYASINSMVREQIGNANEIYLPFIYTLFFFILICNLTGNVSLFLYSNYIYNSNFRIIIYYFYRSYFLGLYIHKIRFSLILFLREHL